MLVNRVIMKKSSKSQNKRGGAIPLLWLIKKLKVNTSENWKPPQREAVYRSQQEAVFLTDQVQYITELS